MARYTEAKCRLCRRENTKLFLKGDRCYSDKCAFNGRNYPPGERGKGRYKKVSEFGIRLREKQKARRIYSILEKQFKNYFKKASKKSGITGENLLQLLETRLDNIVYRMGFAPSRDAARQLVNHGHIKVDGKKVDICSYQVTNGQVISVKETSRGIQSVQEALVAKRGSHGINWIEVNPENFSGKLLKIPSREEIPTPINERLIVEFYSK